MPLPNTKVIGAGPAAAGRAVEPLSMDDACTITSETTRVWGAALNVFVDGPGATIYSGPCRVGPEKTRFPHLKEFGETQVTLTRYVVTIPYTVAGVTKDAVVTITASSDPNLVGRALAVRDFSNSTTQTALRLVCEAIEK